MTMKDWRL